MDRPSWRCLKRRHGRVFALKGRVPVAARRVDLTPVSVCDPDVPSPGVPHLSSRRTSEVCNGTHNDTNWGFGSR